MDRRERECNKSDPILSQRNLTAYQHQLRQGGRGRGGLGGHFLPHRTPPAASTHNLHYHTDRPSIDLHTHTVAPHPGALNDVLHECKFLGMEDVLASVTNLAPNELPGGSCKEQTTAHQEKNDAHTDGSRSTPDGSHYPVENGSPNHSFPSTSYAASPSSSYKSPHGAPSHAMTPGQALYLAAAMTEKSLLGTETDMNSISPELFTAWQETLPLTRRESSVYNNSSLMSPISADDGSPFRQRIAKFKTHCVHSPGALPETYDPLEHKLCNSYASLPNHSVNQAVPSPQNQSPPTVCSSLESAVRGRDTSSNCSSQLCPRMRHPPQPGHSREVVFTLLHGELSMRCHGCQDEMSTVRELVRRAAKAAEWEPVVSTETEVAT